MPIADRPCKFSCEESAANACSWEDVFYVQLKYLEALFIALERYSKDHCSKRCSCLDQQLFFFFIYRKFLFLRKGDFFRHFDFYGSLSYRTVFIPRAIVPKLFILFLRVIILKYPLIPKGHYSKRIFFYLEHIEGLIL